MWHMQHVYTCMYNCHKLSGQWTAVVDRRQSCRFRFGQTIKPHTQQSMPTHKTWGTTITSFKLFLGYWRRWSRNRSCHESCQRDKNRILVEMDHGNFSAHAASHFDNGFISQHRRWTSVGHTRSLLSAISTCGPPFARFSLRNNKSSQVSAYARLPQAQQPALSFAIAARNRLELNTWLTQCTSVVRTRTWTPHCCWLHCIAAYVTFRKLCGMSPTTTGRFVFHALLLALLCVHICEGVAALLQKELWLGWCDAAWPFNWLTKQ